MKVLALILARGGSKGVPGKNIKELLGKPLIAHTIEEAKKSRYINRIVLSTDDSKIAEVGEKYGAEVPFMRSAELAQDDTLDLPVILHALEWLKEHEEYVPDIIAHLVPTAPLRRAEHIDYGIELLLKHPDADAVRSVVKAPKHPLKCWRLENNHLTPFIPPEVYGFKEPYNMPRQKLPEAYVNNGAVNIIKRDTILNKHSITGDVIYGFEMPEKNSVNIDSELDFKLAEIFLKEEKNNFV